MNAGILIVCGGKSSRMGRDKALLHFQGKYLLDHVIAAAKALHLPIALVGNPTLLAPFELPVIPDEKANQGPLRGIVSGLRARIWEKSCVLSCDTPFVTPELLHFLLDSMEEEDILLPSLHGKIHPLIAVYRRQVIPAADTLLDAGDFRMTSLLDAVNSRILDLSNHPEFSAERLYANLNRPEDVKKWE